MSSDQTLNSISSKVIKELDILLRQINPDMVIVHGDTQQPSPLQFALFI